jgi:hypothetical protein
VRIEIVHPAPAGVSTGNRITALRWAGMFRELGHEVRVRREWSGAAVDVLVALNARKSGESIRRCAARSPATHIVGVITGTDLYERLDGLPEMRETLELSGHIVALQHLAAEKLDPSLASRVRTLVQSAPS